MTERDEVMTERDEVMTERDEAIKEHGARYRIERLTRIQKLHNYGDDWVGWKELEEHKAFLNNQGYAIPINFEALKGYE